MFFNPVTSSNPKILPPALETEALKLISRAEAQQLKLEVTGRNGEAKTLSYEGLRSFAAGQDVGIDISRVELFRLLQTKLDQGHKNETLSFLKDSNDPARNDLYDPALNLTEARATALVSKGPGPADAAFGAAFQVTAPKRSFWDAVKEFFAELFSLGSDETYLFNKDDIWERKGRELYEQNGNNRQMHELLNRASAITEAGGKERQKIYDTLAMRIREANPDLSESQAQDIGTWMGDGLLDKHALSTASPLGVEALSVKDFVAHFDPDRSGGVSEQERAAAKQLFDAMETDDDGSLTQMELQERLANPSLMKVYKETAAQIFREAGIEGPVDPVDALAVSASNMMKRAADDAVNLIVAGKPIEGETRDRLQTADKYHGFMLAVLPASDPRTAGASRNRALSVALRGDLDESLNRLGNLEQTPAVELVTTNLEYLKTQRALSGLVSASEVEGHEEVKLGVFSSVWFEPANKQEIMELLNQSKEQIWRMQDQIEQVNPDQDLSLFNIEAAKKHYPSVLKQLETRRAAFGERTFTEVFTELQKEQPEIKLPGAKEFDQKAYDKAVATINKRLGLKHGGATVLDFVAKHDHGDPNVAVSSDLDLGSETAIRDAMTKYLGGIVAESGVDIALLPQKDVPPDLVGPRELVRRFGLMLHEDAVRR